MSAVFTGYSDLTAGQNARGTLREWVFGVTISGTVLYDADTRRIRVHGGDCCIIRPHYSQYWRVPGIEEGGSGRWRTCYCAFTPHPHWHAWLNLLATEELSIFRCSTRQLRGRVARALKRAHSVRTRGGRYADELSMHFIERALLLCVQDVGSAPSSDTIDPRIQKAVDVLTLNPNDTVRLDQLARRCHLSRAHLWSLFQRQIGTTPLQFQERRRIEEAQRRLRSTLDPVRAVAVACGFEDARYFSTRFRKQTGMTPREYRKKQPF